MLNPISGDDSTLKWNPNLPPVEKKQEDVKSFSLDSKSKASSDAKSPMDLLNKISDTDISPEQLMQELKEKYGDVFDEIGNISMPTPQKMIEVSRDVSNSRQERAKQESHLLNQRSSGQISDVEFQAGMQQAKQEFRQGVKTLLIEAFKKL